MEGRGGASSCVQELRALLGREQRVEFPRGRQSVLGLRGELAVGWGRETLVGFLGRGLGEGEQEEA